MSLLDEFREQATASFEEETAAKEKPVEAPKKPRRRGPFLGLTPLQRFTLALLLFFITCIFSALCLLATQRVFPPFLY